MPLSLILSLLLLGLTIALACILVSRRLLHYFQLESYQFRGYFRTLSRQWEKALEPCLLLSAAVLAVLIVFSLLTPPIGRIGGAVSFVLQLLMTLLLCLGLAKAALWIRSRQLAGKEKKPFVLTARVKRLTVCLGLIVCGLLAVLWAIFAGKEKPLLCTAGMALAPLFLPLLTALAGLLALPAEKLIQEAYFQDARKKLLKDSRLIRIGITGSYGKTSTKFILAAILGQKYNVLATPASFNTPMGLTKVIRERLTPAHQVFIGEMGARHPGDIRELCRLVHPQLGILTSVGPQHLDTFGSIETIAKTKYDLIEALPQDGTAYFQHDGGIVTGLFEKTQKPKRLTGVPGSAAWAEDIRVGSFGSSFTLCFEDGERFPCETRLLGAHNINNILCAAAVAKDLGLTQRQIRAGIASLTPVEHRLQIVPTAGDITVIDDAFNTNPTSSKEALRVLSLFPGRKLIVTPGMVELGEKEAEYNREFGRQIADSADEVFLVGRKHTQPILEGLTEKGFPEEHITVCASFDEALAAMRPGLRAGDTVLYENDLPDNYSE